jgi:hypothetical protein
MVKILSILFGTFLLGTSVAYAQFDALTTIPGLTDSGEIGIAEFVNRILILAISVGGLLAVVKISVAGFKYMFTDIVSSKQGAKEDIYGALWGLGILLAGVLILVTINPNFKNLDVFKDAVKVSIVDGEFSSQGAGNVPPPKFFEEGDDAKAYAENQLECPAPYKPAYEIPRVWGKPRAYCDDSEHKEQFSGTVYVAEGATARNDWYKKTNEEREAIIEQQAGIARLLIDGCKKYKGFEADVNEVSISPNMNTGYWRVDCENTR